eukprot:TRINITY_DN7950_c0_g1_i1.p2 TRINITY_DN7950_c0_g1~~TRINITY_DN7950_c0_g1_i1.p2  ORF type:complete len:77 (-),score=10.28 TRINITY_DN7950_c0_g1_i1:81-311(-)
MFMEMDIGLWDKMAKEYEEINKKMEKKVLDRKSNWDTLRQSAEVKRRRLEARPTQKELSRQEAKIKLVFSFLFCLF